MMRYARVVSCVVMVLLAMVTTAQAQTPAATAADDSRFSVAFDFGATFGHKSSGFFGGEGTYRLSGPLGIYVEGGHMMNVGTEDLDQRALTIANAVGATASASYKLNYFDGGLRYAPAMNWSAHPYVLFGVGVAQVSAETVLSVNGTAVPPESLGVQFGNDLNGTSSKPFIVLGGGVTYPLMERFVLDGSLRYGRAMGKAEEGATDSGINTMRLQLGLGVRF
jgi:hypothetical protein